MLIDSLPVLNRKVMYITGAIILIAVIALAIAIPISVSSVGESLPFVGSSVLDEVPLVDGHNDLPYNIYRLEHDRLKNFNLDSDLKKHPKWGNISSSHTDLPRLRKGKVGGQFWVAYVGCDSLDKDAVELTLDQIDVIKRLIKAYPNDLQYADSAEGIWNAFENKKIASLICVEGGHSMDNRLGVLRLYYELGVRYMTLTHSCTLPWADASPVDSSSLTTKHNLTEWGRKVVLEMNRLGMMVDISHVSKGVMLDAIHTSRSPVIFSHSSSWSVYNHHRNVQDDVLFELKKNNGIIMINFYPGFLGNNTIDKAIEHLNYIKNLIGTDNIGIGADYDGVGETPVGLEDVSTYPDLFNKLAESGHGYEPWTREELKKLAGLNLLRVLKDVENVRDSLVNEEPYEDLIPYNDLTRDNQVQGCRTDLDTYLEAKSVEIESAPKKLNFPE
uniref:Dipeptidase n=1 Tax=Culicoides sonorensis TaxID=179676 RepID=A0A336MUI8_CULSO